jgi:hypothetical protein
LKNQWVGSFDKQECPEQLPIYDINNQILDPNLFEYDHLIFPMAELVPTLRKNESSPSLQELSEIHLKQSCASVYGRFSK